MWSKPANRFIRLLPLWGLLLLLGSCRTTAPRVDYRALARASIRLGIDIGPQDNHQLYIEAARWIGTPYRPGGDTRRGTDCSGLTCQLYQKVYRVQLARSTGEQKDQSRKVGRRNLREGDLLFFTSNRSGRKPAHVGIYLKEGKFIHASTSKGVIVSNLDEKYYRDNWISGGRID